MNKSNSTISYCNEDCKCFRILDDNIHYCAGLGKIVKPRWSCEIDAKLRTNETAKLNGEFFRTFKEICDICKVGYIEE